MKVAFPLSQVVGVVVVVLVSKILDPMLSSGVLPRASISTPGTASCTTAMAMWTGTTTPSTTTSLLELPSVASGIDYLSI